MEHRHPVLWGTMILTASGIASRCMGFFYRIFLSHTIGAEGIGIYQLIFPVYTFCFALCVFGIQTAISRLIASALAKNQEPHADCIFLTGTVMALALSFCASITVYTFADWIGTVFLQEPRTVSLLKLLSFSIPFGVFHSCVSAFYYARKKAEIPAFLQLLEQFVRIGSSFLIYQILLSRQITPSAWMAVAGVLAGELISASVCLILISAKKLRPAAPVSFFQTGKEIFTLSLPLTCNRVLLTLLTSIENILIPIRLRLFGLTDAQALSLFGILTGMVMPLLFFPSAITNSMSVMLLPSVAQKQALGENKNITSTIRMTVQSCLLLGLFCFVLFFCFGHYLGILLFQSETAGAFIRTFSFICPFFYLNHTLMSILNGLGKTLRSFLHNLLAVLIRISFTFFCIPIYGIKGYLWGILLGELLTTILNLLALRPSALEQQPPS